MPGTFFPLDNTKYKAPSMGAFLGTRTRGVFLDTDFATSVVSGRTVKVNDGICWLKKDKYWGGVALEPDPQNLTLSVADATRNRWEHICVGINKSTNTYTGVFVRSGNWTTAPLTNLHKLSPRQNANYEEVIVMSVKNNAGVINLSNADIEDERGFDNMCGYMRDGITGIDVGVLYNAWYSWFNDLKAINDQLASWWINTGKPGVEQATIAANNAAQAATNAAATALQAAQDAEAAAQNANEAADEVRGLLGDVVLKTEKGVPGGVATFEAAQNALDTFISSDYNTFDNPFVRNVNFTSGNDITGDGSSGAPWKTITHAVSKFPKNFNGQEFAYIRVFGNTPCDESIRINGFVGGILVISFLNGSFDYTGGASISVSNAKVNISAGLDTLKLKYIAALDSGSIMLGKSELTGATGGAGFAVFAQSNSAIYLPDIKITGIVGPAIRADVSSRIHIGKIEYQNNFQNVLALAGSIISYDEAIALTPGQGFRSAGDTETGGRIYTGSQDQLSGDVEYWVSEQDAVLGGDGSQTNPFLTISQAIGMLPKNLNGKNVKIKATGPFGGEHDEIVIEDFFGSTIDIEVQNSGTTNMRTFFMSIRNSKVRLACGSASTSYLGLGYIKISGVNASLEVYRGVLELYGDEGVAPSVGVRVGLKAENGAVVEVKKGCKLGLVGWSGVPDDGFGWETGVMASGWALVYIDEVRGSGAVPGINKVFHAVDGAEIAYGVAAAGTTVISVEERGGRIKSGTTPAPALPIPNLSISVRNVRGVELTLTQNATVGATYIHIPGPLTDREKDRLSVGNSTGYVARSSSPQINFKTRKVDPLVMIDEDNYQLYLDAPLVSGSVPLIGNKLTWNGARFICAELLSDAGPDDMILLQRNKRRNGVVQFTPPLERGNDWPSSAWSKFPALWWRIGNRKKGEVIPLVRVAEFKAFRRYEIPKAPKPGEEEVKKYLFGNQAANINQLKKGMSINFGVARIADNGFPIESTVCETESAPIGLSFIQDMRWGPHSDSGEPRVKTGY